MRKEGEEVREGTEEHREGQSEEVGGGGWGVTAPPSALASRGAARLAAWPRLLLRKAAFLLRRPPR